MVTCKWYLSPQIPECGKLAVDEVTHIPLRNGSVKKLAEALPVCETHKAHTDRLFASLRNEAKKAAG